MNTPRFHTLRTMLAMLTLAAVVVVPSSYADEKADAAAARKAKRQQDLEKYDTNKDGKINKDERAVKKADDEAAKAAKAEARAAKKKAKESGQ